MENIYSFYEILNLQNGGKIFSGIVNKEIAKNKQNLVNINIILKKLSKNKDFVGYCFNDITYPVNDFIKREEFFDFYYDFFQRQDDYFCKYISNIIFRYFIFLDSDKKIDLIKSYIRCIEKLFYTFVNPLVNDEITGSCIFNTKKLFNLEKKLILQLIKILFFYRKNIEAFNFFYDNFYKYNFSLSDFVDSFIKANCVKTFLFLSNLCVINRHENKFDFPELIKGFENLTKKNLSKSFSELVNCDDYRFLLSQVHDDKYNDFYNDSRLEDTNDLPSFLNKEFTKDLKKLELPKIYFLAN